MIKTVIEAPTGQPIQIDFAPGSGSGAEVVVPDVATMLAIPAGKYGCISLQSYRALGDKGGGLIDWDAFSVATPNDGTIFLPTGHVGAGRLVRRFSGAVHAAWFGCRANEVSDDAVPLQAAITAARFGTLYIDHVGTGGYLTTQTLTVSDACIIEGDSSQGVSLIWGGDTAEGAGILLHLTDAPDSVELRSFSIDNRGGAGIRANEGIRIDGVRVLLHKIRVAGPAAIFDVAAIRTNPDVTVYQVKLEECFVSSRDAATVLPVGVLFERGSTCVLDNCLISDCLTGVVVGGGGGQSVLGFSMTGQCQVAAISTTGANAIGVDLVQVEGFSIDGCNFQMCGDGLIGGAAQRGIRMTSVKGGSIAGCGFDGAGECTSMITIADDGVLGVKIDGNQFHDINGFAVEKTGTGSFWTNEIGINECDTGTDGTFDNSFTPTLTFGGTATGMTGTFLGKAMRKGNYITAQIDVELTALGSSVGAPRLGGLPLASIAAFNVPGALMPLGLNGVAGGIVAFLPPAATAMRIFCTVTGASVELDNTSFGNASKLYASITYEVAAPGL